MSTMKSEVSMIKYRYSRGLSKRRFGTAQYSSCAVVHGFNGLITGVILS